MKHLIGGESLIWRENLARKLKHKKQELLEILDTVIYTETTSESKMTDKIGLARKVRKNSTLRHQ